MHHQRLPILRTTQARHSAGWPWLGHPQLRTIYHHWLVYQVQRPFQHVACSCIYICPVKTPSTPKTISQWLHTILPTVLTVLIFSSSKHVFFLFNQHQQGGMKKVPEVVSRACVACKWNAMHIAMQSDSENNKIMGILLGIPSDKPFWVEQQ